MTHLPGAQSCCGCSACFVACPRRAISLQPDEEGFLQPRVDMARCVHCTICEKVCPVLNRKEARHPLYCLLAKSRNDDELLQSSSGGMFSLLAHDILSDAGVVYGAGWDTGTLEVAHRAVECDADLVHLRGSKYVQSALGNVFQEVVSSLRTGRRVLFVGTPCQIAGLYGFLGKEHVNPRLLTVEIICNSVPSPRMLREFVGHYSSGRRVEALCFRDKARGWHHATLKLLFGDGSSCEADYATYHQLWQKGYAVRRSCQNCAFRDFRSGADLTIGDAWHMEGLAPDLYDDRGVSSLIVNTERGHLEVERIRGAFRSTPVDLERLLPGNPCLHETFFLLAEAGPRRDVFWKKVNGGADFLATGRSFVRAPLLVRIRGALGRFLRRMGRKR